MRARGNFRLCVICAACLMGLLYISACRRDTACSDSGSGGVAEEAGNTAGNGENISPRMLARLIATLDPWEAPEFSRESWSRYYAIAELLQECGDELVIHAFREYSEDALRNAKTVGLTRELSKAYILMRVLFELPEETWSGDGGYRGGWFGWSNEDPAEMLYANSPSWPIAWTEEGATLVSGCGGYSGPPYSPDREYQAMRDRFAYRSLSP